MLEHLEPKSVFYWFEELTKIPRCSREEKQVSEYLQNFAKERQLEYYTDHEQNVIIKKPATKGMENAPAVIIQGHMDMVCEKTKDSTHDFTCDALELSITDGWIHGNNTTLGGDDGIAVAYALAILDADDIVHPPLEVLITTQEELGMEGAQAVTSEHLTGKYLFNIDGEVEGELLVGCAGGMTIESVREICRIEKSLSDCYEIEIGELTGGHSGQEIEKSRANSIKTLARLLDQLEGIEIVELTGGSKHNAIPIHATAKIYCTEKAKEEIEKRMVMITKERQFSDPHMTLTLTACEKTESDVWNLQTQTDILNAIMAMPDGVIYMDPVFAGLVQTSISNGILRSDHDKVTVTTLLRSSVRSAMEEERRRYGIIMESFGFTVSDDGGYPAWEYDGDSKLRELAKEVYRHQYQEEPIVKTIHCGLECGILKVALPDTDMLTFGPDMVDIHTPKEKLHIESVGRVWEFTKSLLKAIGEQ